MISEIWDDEHLQQTDVSLASTNGGAGIYCAIGLNLNVKVHWQDDLTIVIETNKNYNVISKKFDQIQFFEDLFNIAIIEN